MNFKINNRDWKIVELSQDEMRNVIKNYKYDGEPKEGNKASTVLSKMVWIQSQRIIVHDLIENSDSQN